MESEALAEVAAVLAEPARAAMCLVLIDGRAWTVGELRRAARVAPSTASEHVARLLEVGFVEALRQGRHRYIRITDPRVAELSSGSATTPGRGRRSGCGRPGSLSDWPPRAPATTTWPAGSACCCGTA